MSSLHLRILEELNPHGESCCCPERDDCPCRGAGGMQDAAAIVRAVLELHGPKPVDYLDAGDTPRSRVDCALCDSGGGWPQGWPCPTLLVIAKELGIEVAGE